MQVYGVRIERQIELTYRKYSYDRFFDSKESMENFIRWFNEQEENQSTLVRIIKKGKCKWNERGMLIFQ